MEKQRKIRTLSRREDWTDAVLYQLDRQEDSLLLESKKYPMGFVCFPVIDSCEPGFRWSRAWLEGSFPQDTTVRLRCFLSDSLEEWEGGFDWRMKHLCDEPDPLYAAQTLFGAPISDGTDFLIPGSGQYLRLMAELGSTSGENPSISALRVQVTADHMTDYLPAIYRDSDFTYRFLSIFDSMVSDMEQRIDAISAELDVQEANDEMLSYLASWLCLEPSTDRAAIQQQMKTALDDYETMYSVEGIRRTIRRLTGHDAVLIEGKDVDPNSPDAGDSDMLRQLYGDDPFRFFVLLDESVFPTVKDRENFISQMRHFIPAGVEMELVTLRPGIQLGWHTYLGINTVLKGYVAAVIGDNTSIYIDTMIGGNE